MLIHNLKTYSLHLVSQSPRRQELMSAMGLNFSILKVDTPELYPTTLSATEIAEYLAQLKISSINFDDFSSNSIFISCDTIVELDNKILGKPNNRQEAIQILESLSGKTHRVISGLCIARKEKQLINHSITKVQFDNFTEQELAYYVTNYMPLDKAGAYGAQEWIGMIGINSLEGSFYNVMGLPTQLLWSMLKAVIS